MISAYVQLWSRVAMAVVCTYHLARIEEVEHVKVIIITVISKSRHTSSPSTTPSTTPI